MTEVTIHPSALEKIPRHGKRLNKRLLERLALFNLELLPPAEILARLEIFPQDLGFLEKLAFLPDGWHDYVPSPHAGPVRSPLAELGLILVKPRIRQLCLSDAGRFLLVLAR